jgi:hypothetical protein
MLPYGRRRRAGCRIPLGTGRIRRRRDERCGCMRMGFLICFTWGAYFRSSVLGFGG